MLDYTDLKDRGGLSSSPGLGELPFVNVLGGDPEHSFRLDLGDFASRLHVGVWQCSTGRFEYTYPGNEICTLLEGKVTITDADGVAHHFAGGDTFFTHQGETVTWEVLEPVRKIFQVYNPDGEGRIASGSCRRCLPFCISKPAYVRPLPVRRL